MYAMSGGMCECVECGRICDVTENTRFFESKVESIWLEKKRFTYFSVPNPVVNEQNRVFNCYEKYIYKNDYTYSIDAIKTN